MTDDVDATIRHLEKRMRTFAKRRNFNPDNYLCFAPREVIAELRGRGNTKKDVIVAGHQVGAASAAFFGGTMRELSGNYELAFLIAGMTAIAAACISLLIDTTRPAFAAEPQAA